MDHDAAAEGCGSQARPQVVATRVECRVDLFCRDAAPRFGLHGVIDREHLVAPPAVDVGVAPLPRAQARTHHLACRRVGAGLNERVDIIRLGGRQTDGALFNRGHRFDPPDEAASHGA